MTSSRALMWRGASSRRISLLVSLLLSLGAACGGASQEGAAGGAQSRVQVTPVGAECASALLRNARLELEAASETDRPALAACTPVAGERWLALSLGRPASSALVAQGRGEDLAAALAEATADLRSRSTAEERRSGRLKLDVVTGRVDAPFDSEGRARIDRTLHGLFLPDDKLPDGGLLLLPEELSTRRLFNSKQDLQSGRLRDYLAEGVRGAVRIAGNPGKSGAPYGRLELASYFEGEGGAAVELYRGNRLEQDLSPEGLLAAAVLGGDYLLRHQHPDGSFDYTYQVKTDEVGGSYNLLRHAGACYSLFELYEATRDKRYLEAGSRGLEWLRQHFRGPKPEDEAQGFLAVVSPGEEAKLGGAALAVLAMLRYQQVTGDDRWLPDMKRLARFMVFQQDEDGKFASKYFYGKPDPKPFDSIYYPGEAILALARLSRIDPEGPWLEASMDGAGWLIGVRDLGKTVDRLPHDHWLLIGLDELYQLSDQGRTFYIHGRRIADSILRAQRRRAQFPDWVGTFYTPPRSTPTATRAEALVAMAKMAHRAGDDTRRYIDALRLMAAFERRTQLYDESLLYAPRPDLARGGFRRGLDHWEVRIDYVQHNLSALLGLRQLLLDGAPWPVDSGPKPATP
ncbi:MAG: hypothetical protein KDD11_01410 [Acidobacteria bacterium]|nr:hypothetical protein [Acidobacteriota bacterium]